MTVTAQHCKKKQIYEQLTMCVKEDESGTSRNEGLVAENESHRVDEINVFEKFQSTGVGDPRRRWLVDSGAHMSYRCRTVAV